MQGFVDKMPALHSRLALCLTLSAVHTASIAAPIHDMVRKGDAMAVILELGRGADINAVSEDGRSTPLTLAIERQHRTLFDLLLEDGADAAFTPPGGWSPLLAATQQGNISMITALLQFGASPDQQGIHQWTALYLSIRNDRADIAALLLEKGANPNLADASGQTPLHSAAIQGNITLAEQLLARGADIQFTDLSGRTALYLSLQANRPEMVKFLLSHGAMANHADNQGITPLHLCAPSGQISEIPALLKAAGANPDARNQDHLTPMELARKNNTQDFFSISLMSPDERHAAWKKALQTGKTTLENFPALTSAAIPYFEQAIRYKPDDMAGLLLRGMANGLDKSGSESDKRMRMQAAENDFRQAAVSSPHNALIHYWRGHYEHALHHRDAAVSLLKSAAAMHPPASLAARIDELIADWQAEPAGEPPTDSKLTFWNEAIETLVKNAEEQLDNRREIYRQLGNMRH